MHTVTHNNLLFLTSSQSLTNLVQSMKQNNAVVLGIIKTGSDTIYRFILLTFTVRSTRPMARDLLLRCVTSDAYDDAPRQPEHVFHS